MNRTAHNDAPLANAAGQALYDMVTRQAPAETVRRFLRDEFDIAAKLGDLPAYIQPNGFHTYKLAGTDGDYLLRLHYWPPGLPDAGDSAGIHDHIFDFTSLVLAGDAAMINTHYEMAHAPESPLALYKVDYTSARESQIIKLGDHFRPVVAARDIVPAGAYYTFPAGSFHTSMIDGNAEAFTLLATKLRPGMDGPRFLAPSTYAGDNSTYRRQDPGPAQRAHVAARLRHFLGQSILG